MHGGSATGPSSTATLKEADVRSSALPVIIEASVDPRALPSYLMGSVSESLPAKSCPPDA
jgi:hypothetical protein